MTCDGGLGVRRRWTAAARVGCGRPTVLIGAAGFIPAEPHRGKRVTSNGGARGGNRVSPTLRKPAVSPALLAFEAVALQLAGPDRDRVRGRDDLGGFDRVDDQADHLALTLVVL